MPAYFFFGYVKAWDSDKRPAAPLLEKFYAGLREMGFLLSPNAPTFDDFKQFNLVNLKFFSSADPPNGIGSIGII